MQLPPALRLAIEAETASLDAGALRHGASELSERYREGKFAGALTTGAHRAAYLLTRLPATYAANALVFRELATRIDAQPGTLLDLGCGPGTAMWAAAEALPSAQSFTNVERDAAFLDTARRLASHSLHPGVRDARFLAADIRKAPELPPHDIVVLSYAFGELGQKAELVRWAWELARAALVIVEPGTPKAFLSVLQARDQLIALGATIAAPCPHHHRCPLAAGGDWCHFRVRLERTSEHRRLKGGELGYEDEKFSYVIASRSIARPVGARIVRHPLKHSGHVRLTLCTANGMQSPTIGKAQKQLYREARGAEWGDAWCG